MRLHCERLQRKIYEYIYIFFQMWVDSSSIVYVCLYFVCQLICQIQDMSRSLNLFLRSDFVRSTELVYRSRISLTPIIVHIKF